MTPSYDIAEKIVSWAFDDEFQMDTEEELKQKIAQAIDQARKEAVEEAKTKDYVIDCDPLHVHAHGDCSIIRQSNSDIRKSAFLRAAEIAESNWKENPPPQLKDPSENAELTSLRIRDAIRAEMEKL